jgi:hypothetical protein
MKTNTTPPLLADRAPRSAIVYVFEKRTAPVVLFVAVTLIVPEIVKLDDGESIDIVPVVLTLTPVNVVELLRVKDTGVTMTKTNVLWTRVPLVSVTLTE